MNDDRLAHWRILITGGGSGIGLGCARRFLADGASVTLMGRSRARLEAAAAGLGASERLRIAEGDVAVEADLERAVAIASDDGRRLDVAVASAGTGGLAPIVAQSLEDFDRVMRTNLNGTFLTLKHAGAAIAASGGGALCAISSIAGLRTHRFGGAYCASKAAIDMLVRNTADELGVAGVRCNSVLPGLVETDLSQALQDDPDVLADYLDCMPIRRTGTVTDVAEAVRFLCGPEASWITGVQLSVDGGQHLRRGPNWEKFARMAYGDAAVEGRPS
ncbi:MAG: SDR family oxidoreductase [Pseudomonadales bacterium]|jgi:NAD(P)-dependent dehydrogenase (short-subunit alcohol dehydrogenase family)|nr:SDR family oxidoreductase [Pseudomonadales bacterium]